MIGPNALVGVIGLSSVGRLENLDSVPLPVSGYHKAVIAFVREMGGRIAIEVASIVSKAVERLSVGVFVSPRMATVAPDSRANSVCAHAPIALR